jgi:hypothetical protein
VIDKKSAPDEGNLRIVAGQFEKGSYDLIQE